MFQPFPFCLHQMTTFNPPRVPWVVPSAGAVPRSTAAVHGNVDPRHPCACPCGWRVGTCGCCGDVPKCILDISGYSWLIIEITCLILFVCYYKAGLPWNTLNMYTGKDRITVVKAGVGSVLFGYIAQVLRDQIGARKKQVNNKIEHIPVHPCQCMLQFLMLTKNKTMPLSSLQ